MTPIKTTAPPSPIPASIPNRAFFISEKMTLFSIRVQNDHWSYKLRNNMLLVCYRFA